MLTKTRAVLHLRTALAWEQARGGGTVTFAPEFGEPGPSVRMSHDNWADMSSPKTITVTIEPGDLLNTE